MVSLKTDSDTGRVNKIIIMGKSMMENGGTTNGKVKLLLTPLKVTDMKANSKITKNQGLVYAFSAME